MASQEVTKQRTKIAIARIRAGADRLGAAMGRTFEFQKSKDPDVAQALFLEAVADMVDELDLAPEPQGQEEVVECAPLDGKPVLQALFPDDQPGFYEVEVNGSNEVVAVRRFVTKRAGRCEKVL